MHIRRHRAHLPQIARQAPIARRHALLAPQWHQIHHRPAPTGGRRERARALPRASRGLRIRRGGGRPRERPGGVHGGLAVAEDALARASAVVYASQEDVEQDEDEREAEQRAEERGEDRRGLGRGACCGCGTGGARVS